MTHATMLPDPRERCRVIRICVTGPESTGKTRLAHRLSAHFHAERVPEASRLYAERVTRELVVGDVERIADDHIAMADDATRRVIDRGGGTIILDTDLISTIVYGRHYYDFASDWLQDEARARRADLYLLCDVDVPWVSDGIRDRPRDRDAMFTRFVDALDERRANSAIVRGAWDARWERAVAACRASRDPDAAR